MTQSGITPAHSEAGRAIRKLYEQGQLSGWHGFIGSSVSRWLRPADLREFQACLDWSQPYRPIDAGSYPRLARECFLFSQQEGTNYGEDDNPFPFNFQVIQVSGDGTSYRILWEKTLRHHPPMELSIHLTVHSVRSNGPGGVVYHCQPINTIALAALNREWGRDLVEELSHGVANVRNVVPDGIDVVPWGMTGSIQLGATMSPEMLVELTDFLKEIGEHTKNHQAVMLDGEGIICSSCSEYAVFGLINTVEHAAEIRLKMLSAGGK